MEHSRLPMQKNIKLAENAFKFLPKVFIMLQKEVPYQYSCILIATVLVNNAWRENMCVHNPFHKMFHPRENWGLTAT